MSKLEKKYNRHASECVRGKMATTTVIRLHTSEQPEWINGATERFHSNGMCCACVCRIRRRYNDGAAAGYISEFSSRSPFHCSSVSSLSSHLFIGPSSVSLYFSFLILSGSLSLSPVFRFLAAEKGIFRYFIIYFECWSPRCVCAVTRLRRC